MIKEPTEKEAFCLEQCKKKIEEKLQWGSSVEWSNTDFIKLSELIEQQTSKPISHTTLKRIWGKVKYTNIPQTHTLNTLAEFAGFENWLLFKTSISSSKLTSQKDVNESTKKSLPFTSKKLIRNTILAIGAFIIVGSIISFIYRNQKTKLPAELANKASFSSKPMVKGIPNTVIFKYDVSQIPGHIYEIQQSWDKRKQFKISKDQHEVTSMYYYPGYFRAKLLVDEQIIKEHDLLIGTEGWLGLIQQSPTPRYLLNEEITKNGFLSVSKMVEDEINNQPESPQWLQYNYINQNLLDFDCDNMSLELSLKNTFQKGTGLCKNTRVIVLGTEGIFYIPLAYKGCTGDLGLKFRDAEQEGPKDNLTGFGCDFKDWEKLRVETLNKQVKIFLNDQVIKELSYNDAAGRLAGIRIKFQGLGQINYVDISNNEGKQFREDFSGNL